MRAAIPLAAFLIITTAAAAQSPPPYQQGQPGPGPYDAPQGAPPVDQQGGPPPGGAPYSGAPQGGHGMKAMEKFQAANTTHDGKLTLQQAQAANLHPIIRNFAAIDREHKGYVTVQDIREWRQARRAAQQQQAAPPPAPPPPPPQ